jgi:hypothetical protein
MNITSASYNQDGSINAIIDDVTYLVPDDMSNRYRQALDVWVTDGNIITAYTIPAPTDDDINDERDRRIYTGSTFAVTGAGNVRLIGDSQTRDNLQALQSVASILLASGDTTTITPYRDADNITHNLTQSQVIELFIKSAKYLSDLYTSSWTIKAMNPIPFNYQDDSFWTVND